MLEFANMVRRKAALENKWALYEIINKFPGLSGYELSKKIEWTPGKTDHYLKKLLKEGLILNSTEIVNGRGHKSYRPKEMKDMINWKEMKNL